MPVGNLVFEPSCGAVPFDWLEKNIGQAHKRDDWQEAALLDLQGNYAQAEFVFKKYGGTAAGLEKIAIEGQMARAGFGIDKIKAAWKDVESRRGSITLPTFMEGLMIIAFRGMNSMYDIGTTPPPSMAITPLSACISSVLSKCINRLAIEQQQVKNVAYEQAVAEAESAKYGDNDQYKKAWPYSKRQLRRIMKDLKKIKKERNKKATMK